MSCSSIGPSSDVAADGPRVAFGPGMSTDLEPKNESLRKAVRWISENLKDNPAADIKALVLEAGFRYDLGPLDQEFLWNKLVVEARRPQE
jgi:hypothetical protein